MTKRLYFANTKVGWIIDAFERRARLLKSVNGGKTWTEVVIEGSLPTDFHFFDADRGLVLTSRGLYSTSDGGDSWRKVKISGQDFDNRFDRVVFTDPTTGLVQGSSIWITENGGNTWWSRRFETAIFESHVIGIEMPERDRCWMLTERGLYLSTDTGATWQRQKVRLGNVEF